jgi:3-phenylpropionate/cinnamic acid dioxygenase small subunit
MSAGNDRSSAQPAHPIGLADLLARAAIDALNHRYVEAIDSGHLEAWPACFTAEGLYRAQGRENYDRNLPLALMECRGTGMFADRVLVIQKIMVYAPRTIRHVVSPAQLIARHGDSVTARTSFCVFHTLPHAPTELLSVGRYEDRIVGLDSGTARFAERIAIYDTLLVPGALVYPL